MYKLKITTIFLVFIFFPIISNSETLSTFSNIQKEDKVSDDEFVNFIRDTIIIQPDFLQATAKKGELIENKKYAQRLRFPTIDAQLYNDRTISRDIETNALRKTRDDTFDGVISIDQKLYSGNEVNSKINIAKNEMHVSNVERSEVASKLVIQAVDIYLNAASAVLLSEYSSKILDNLKRYKETAKARFNAGAIENTEFALINIRLSEIEVKIALLDANKIQNLSLFRSFYKDEYNNRGLPDFKLSNLEDAEIENFSESYEQVKSKIGVKISEHNLELTKSQYRPHLGFNARYTQYDIDDEAKDTDIRGGFYVKFPLFSFGRGSAEVNASKARVRQAKINNDVKLRETKNTTANVFGSYFGAMQARDRILEAYKNVKLQRETFEIRMAGSSFSTAALLDAAQKEIAFYEQLIENEKRLFLADLQVRHLNRELLSRFNLSL